LNILDFTAVDENGLRQALEGTWTLSIVDGQSIEFKVSKQTVYDYI